MVKTWLPSKPMTRATFCCMFLSYTSYSLEQSMLFLFTDIKIINEHDFSTNKFLPGTSYRRKQSLSFSSANFNMRISLISEPSLSAC